MADQQTTEEPLYRIKPLVWRDTAATDASRAGTLTGEYYACAGQWAFYLPGSSSPSKSGETDATIGAAKAAAEAHYRARLSTALEQVNHP